MSALELAAALIQARHQQDQMENTLIAAVRDAEDRELLMAETIGLLVGLLHGAGHISAPVAMMLDVFAHAPEAATKGHKRDVHVVRADDIDEDTTADLFTRVTEGTTQADRVWGVGVIPGGVNTVTLEGSGFHPRHIAVVGATPEQVETLKGQLAAKDGR